MSAAINAPCRSGTFTTESRSNPSGLQPHWLRALDGAVWLGMAVLVLFTISRHEPWADEAQSWLLARDSGWFSLIFKQLRYEGHPGLWHSILWVAIRVFHMRYAALGYLGGAFALGGLAVVVFCAPFPRILRYLIATSFFFIYQYAVIARSYELLPLLAFGSACLLRRGVRQIIPFAVALSLMAHVSLHGAVIAIALALGCMVWHRPKWHEYQAEQKKNIVAAAGIFGLALLLLPIILFPPHSKTLAMADAETFTLRLHLLKSFHGLCAAVCDYEALALLLLLLIGIWCFERRGLPAMLVAVGGTTLIYGFLRGARHHEGLILIALLTAIWAVWPKPEELAGLPNASRHLHAVLVATLSLLFAYQTYWSVVAIRNDWKGPYSGAPDAAMFLKSIQADTKGCYGYNFWIVGLQAYFDHNILANFGGPAAPAYYHNALDFHNSVAGWPAFLNRNVNPACVVMSIALDPNESFYPATNYIVSQGYELVHISDGTAFFKDEPGEHQLYLIFMRQPGVPEQLPQATSWR